MHPTAFLTSPSAMTVHGMHSWMEQCLAGTTFTSNVPNSSPLAGIMPRKYTNNQVTRDTLFVL